MASSNDCPHILYLATCIIMRRHGKHTRDMQQWLTAIESPFIKYTEKRRKKTIIFLESAPRTPVWRMTLGIPVLLGNDQHTKPSAPSAASERPVDKIAIWPIWVRWRHLTLLVSCGLNCLHWSRIVSFRALNMCGHAGWIQQGGRLRK